MQVVSTTQRIPKQARMVGYHLSFIGCTLASFLCAAIALAIALPMRDSRPSVDVLSQNVPFNFKRRTNMAVDAHQNEQRLSRQVEKGEVSSNDTDSTPNRLTLDPCEQSQQCVGFGECLSLTDGLKCDGGDCRCIPLHFPSVCQSDNSCSDGERCVVLDELEIDLPFLQEDVKGFQACVSRLLQQNAPCIAMKSIDHLPRDELVFKTDPIAHVLCDNNESCATPGHMVKHKGKGMMMKTYCAIIRDCKWRLMRVNSPKHRKGTTVLSQSKDLVFTTFASRYATRAEEVLLALAIRYEF